MSPVVASAQYFSPVVRPVRRRIVFYVSGFDPNGPAHYYRLFVEQAREQAITSGYSISVGKRQTAHPHMSTWQVQFANDQGDVVATDYRFLRWDDLVRLHWPRGRGRLAWLTVCTAARLLSNGSWWSMCRTSRVAGFTLALPFLVLMLGVSLGAACFIAMIMAMNGWANTLSVLPGWTLLIIASAGSFAGLAKLWRFGQGDWLMRSCSSLLQMARGEAPEMDARVASWAEAIAAAVSREDIDEVQVVAHSSGCIAAVSALAKVLRTRPEHADRSPQVSFLTLGQCIPVLSYQPQAVAFRADLLHVSQSTMAWVDVTAPPDACCFALMDPTYSPHHASYGPSSVKRVSPRYAEQLTPSRYKAMKSDKYRCHFQYLMAFDSSQHYDLFKWVCGPASLQESTSNLKSISNFTRFQW